MKVMPSRAASYMHTHVHANTVVVNKYCYNLNIILIIGSNEELLSNIRLNIRGPK